MSTVLTLSPKGEYFQAIKAGTKCQEFRLCSPDWIRRLEGRSFSAIVLTHAAAHLARKRGSAPKS